MEMHPIEGTFTESPDKDEWWGTYFTCNECDSYFMPGFDSENDIYYCPYCGKRLKRSEQ